MNRRMVSRLLGVASIAPASLWRRSVRAQDRPQNLLWVHGRGQGGYDPAVLKEEWTRSLLQGAHKHHATLSQEVVISFPYYGKVLDDFVRESQLPLTSQIQSRGDGRVDDFLTFQFELANEIRRREGITDAQVSEQYGEEPRDRGPLNWQWVQAILRTIDLKSKTLNQATLEAFTRDVYLYLKYPRVRSTIDEIVARSLSDKPTVVVGHSLGSVVSFNVLRRTPTNYQVPLFATIGSPLAVRAVRSRLEPIGVPSPVKGWFNAYDPRDVVSLYPLDKDNFDVTPAIENFGAVDNSTDNRHGVKGYLEDPTVALRIIRTFG